MLKTIFCLRMSVWLRFSKNNSAFLVKLYSNNFYLLEYEF